MSSKSVGLTREASALFGNNSPASAKLGSHLSSHAELLSSKAEPPLVWFSPSIFANQRLSESLRFGMLEIQEHLETFLDKKDHATEVKESFLSSPIEIINKYKGRIMKSLKSFIQKDDKTPFTFIFLLLFFLFTVSRGR